MSAPWQPTHPAPLAYEPAAGPAAPQYSRGSNVAQRAGMVAGIVVLVFTAAFAGVIVGAQITSRPTASPSAAAPSSGPHAAGPDPTQVRAQTIDLCTRFAAAYSAYPSPQKSAADVVPTANYISDALHDNPIADPGVRSAMTESLHLFRDHAAGFSHEPAKGAVQPPTGWTAAAANAADEAVWSACNGYQG